MMSVSKYNLSNRTIQKVILWILPAMTGAFGQAQEPPFAMPAAAEPVFPDAVFDIRSYGAVGDGFTLNTEAFRSAIEACVKAGGGKVLVPPGTWATGPIILKSRVNLHVSGGALIKFTPNYDEYPLMYTRDSGIMMKEARHPLLFADKQEDVAITGRGVIDGSGEAWRTRDRDRYTEKQWEKIIYSGGVVSPDGSDWFPTGQTRGIDHCLYKLLKEPKQASPEEADRLKGRRRPPLVQIRDCRRILLDGPTFQNSPFWNIHLLFSEDIIVRNIFAYNDWNAQNGDGINFDSCRNVRMYDSQFRTGDDAIVIKSGRNEDGRRIGKPSENIIISNCVANPGHGGCTIGSEMSGGVRNVYFHDCQFNGTDRGIWIKSMRGRGGVVENVWFENIVMNSMAREGFVFTMHYHDTPAEPVSERTPVFRNIFVKNVSCNGFVREAIILKGLPEMPFGNIRLENIRMKGRKGLVAADVKEVELINVSIQALEGPIFTISDGFNIKIERSAPPEGTDAFLKLDGEKTGNIEIVNCDLKAFPNAVLLGEHVPKDAVKQK